MKKLTAEQYLLRRGSTSKSRVERLTALIVADLDKSILDGELNLYSIQTASLSPEESQKVVKLLDGEFAPRGFTVQCDRNVGGTYSRKYTLAPMSKEIDF